MSHLCVNTLPASQVTLISHECIRVTSLESVLRSYFSLAFAQLFQSCICAVSLVLHLVNGMECWV